MSRAAARKQAREAVSLPIARVVKRGPAVPAWQLWLFAATACALAFWAYSPSLNGEFVFDDLHLPIAQQAAGSLPVSTFLGVRPLLMLTYYVNLHQSGLQPFPYHLVNLLFHVIAGVLLFFIARKILELRLVAEPARTTLSALLSAIFLLHPMQTEAVSYIAQRGETMGAMLFFAAWCLFLYRKRAQVSWPVAAGILLLYGAAVGTKEHTVTLPAVLLLTDFFFHPKTPGIAGIRANRRLYLPLLVGGAVGAIAVGRYISRDAASIGFNLKEFTWYQYLFTQWRVVFLYLGLFILPLWQTIDHDFSISRTPLDHGAIFALLGIVGLIAAAVYFRKRYPLASFGLLLFLVMLLPTSSVIPIKDVAADRRLYLPMTGLLFVCAEFLRRTSHLKAITGVVAVVLAAGTFARNQAWASSLTLWQDAAQKAPSKARVQFGVAVAEFRAGHCHQAVEHYRRAAELEKPDYTLLMNWSLALECDNQTEKAIAKMNESLHDKPSAQAWASMGVLYAHQGKATEAMDALQKAQTLDPAYPTTYFYRAKILAAMDNAPEAIRNLKQVLAVDPSNESARALMDQLQRQVH